MVVSLAVVSQNPGASWLVDGYPPNIMVIIEGSLEKRKEEERKS